MKKINQMLSIAMLVFAIVFNIWIYRLEPSAKVDPNDNAFQFALVYRTNQIWDFASKKCSGNILTYPLCHFSYLADHWVPNWNEGYNLPFYYSHIPQIIIVGSWRIIHLVTNSLSLFTYYHFVIYLLLCLFPLSVFLALRVTGQSWLTAGFGALLAGNISTDGLYGLDPSSFLWRGYGLSSQLFAMLWFPLAIAYTYRCFTKYTTHNIKFEINAKYFKNLLDKKIPSDLFFAILFLILTTAGHLGIGIMAFLSLVPLGLATPVTAFLRRLSLREITEPLKKNVLTLCIISAVAIFILSYWILPAMSLDAYHNFSFWDPVWKFNSYGVKEIITRLGNGALFDFGRLPIMTGLVVVGFLVLLGNQVTGLTGFSYLFLFFLFLYFGRTTWGNLLNIIPSMSEFHQSRFIVGVHIAGMFLAPIGLTWIISRVSKRLTVYPSLLTIPLCILIIALVYPQTVNYATYNDTLITQANGNYAKQSTDANALINYLQELEKTAPGRVFAGRGGSWGKDFRIAETPMYMYLSDYSLPSVLWLPETWSPNGDTEQYFRENFAEDYDLYHIRYVATPANLAKETIQPFWKLIKENPSWKLYEVFPNIIPAKSGTGVSSKKPIPIRQPADNNTMGYFTAGVRPAIVAADKYSRTNVIRLWIQSDDPKNGLYPQLTFDTKRYPVNVGLPNFKMLDEVTFQVPDGSTHNVFTEPPRYISPLTNLSNLKITDQTDDTDMIFTARVSVPKNCTECMVILKQSFHPNWRVSIDGQPVTPIITFPFFIGIPVSTGNHTIIASYEPSRLKVFLLMITLITLTGVIALVLKNKIHH